MPGAKSSGAPAASPPPAWVAALHETFPDVEWVDSDLDLGEGRRVDWVGVESSGRIVFALFCDGSSDASVISVLDTNVFFERHRAVLGQHLRSPRVRAALAPVIALVAEAFSPRVLARLACIQARTLKLFELRQLTTSRSDRAYLVPVGAAAALAPAPQLRGPQSFLAGLGERVRPLGELLVRRIARIDDQLVASAGDRCLSWRLGEEALCSVAQIEDRLEVQVGPDGGLRTVSNPVEVEAFVDEALGRYVALLGGPPIGVEGSAEDGRGTEAPGGFGSGFGAGGGAQAHGGLSSLGPGDVPALSPLDLGLALSPEELAAFRQSG